MKHGGGIVAVVGLALALAGRAAADGRFAVSAPDAAQGEGVECPVARGEVERVDTQREIVGLKGGQELSLERSTVVIKDGRAASLKDIDRGDDVRASFAPDCAVQEVSASTSWNRVKDGIPETRQHEFLQQVWTAG